MGAWKTTPINSLEVECNISPLSIHRKLLICIYYCRALQLSSSLPVVKELFRVNYPGDKPFCGNIYVAPLATRAEKLLADINVDPFVKVFSSLISPVPPWYDISQYFLPDFMDVTIDNMACYEAKQTFSDLMENRYNGYLSVFTDGSRITNPVESTSAAMTIPSLSVNSRWKLSPYITVLGAELFAIKYALIWLKNNLVNATNVVIFSDSLSSIYFLLDRTPKNIFMYYI